MNLRCYSASNTERPIFGGLFQNKTEARKFILNHGMLAMIDFILYRNKRYSIGQIYKWKG